MKQKFNVNKMTCSTCQAHVSVAVNALDGVKVADVNLLSNSMMVEYEPLVVTADDIIAAVKKAGYEASIYTGEKINYDLESKKMKRRIIISFVFLIPLLYVSMGHMLHLPLPEFILSYQHGLLYALLQLLLTIPIIVVNYHYFKNGFKNLFTLHPNMDTLIALSSSAAIIYGLINTVIIVINPANAHDLYMDLYYEAAGTILTLVTLGKYIESKSKKRTSEAINKLVDLSPKTAIRLQGEVEEEINVEAVKIDDILVVKPGMLIPVDGLIIAGNASIDEATITGESVPVNKEMNDKVISATKNLNGRILIKATTVSSESTISQIIKLVEEASNSKAPIAALADKISFVFVPIVMGISVLSFIVWLCVGQSLAFSLQIAISVLVISCPCALGLATPVAIMVGTGEAAKSGILVKSATALQTAHGIDVVVLDKTGTITYGLPSVSSVIGVKVEEKELLNLALALENNSTHPLSKAVVNYAYEQKLQLLKTDSFNYLPGKGIEAVINGNKYITGNKKHLQENGVNLDAISLKIKELALNGETPLIYAKNSEILGIIGVSDQIRPTSKKAISLFHSLGLKVIMLTGDNKLTAEAIKNKVLVDEVIAEVLPAEKKDVIVSLQASGHKVAMVGDGINDSVALTAADIGIAIGAGSDIAIDSADIILVKNNLIDAYNAIRLSKKVIMNVKENLFWAFIYNIVGIPIAAGVFYGLGGLKLSPMLGSLAMSFSSVCVVLNALRLKRFKQYKIEGENKMIKTIQVDKMMCQNCVKHVSEALMQIEGITNVIIDLKKKKVDIEISKEVETKAIYQAVEAAGYIPSEYVAKKGVFFHR